MDPTKFNQQNMVQFPSVSDIGFWEGVLDSVKVDGREIGLKGRTVILDTGTVWQLSFI